MDLTAQLAGKGQTALYMEHPHEGLIHHGHPMIVLEAEWNRDVSQRVYLLYQFLGQPRDLVNVGIAEQFQWMLHTHRAIRNVLSLIVRRLP